MYRILQEELGGEENGRMLVKLFFINLNRVELLNFLALAPEFLDMVRRNKREFFLDAYMGGNKLVILNAVKILDLPVKDMTPPPG